MPVILNFAATLPSSEGTPFHGVNTYTAQGAAGLFLCPTFSTASPSCLDVLTLQTPHCNRLLQQEAQKQSRCRTSAYLAQGP